MTQAIRHSIEDARALARELRAAGRHTRIVPRSDGAYRIFALL